jgi:hypothetical protein
MKKLLFSFFSLLLIFNSNAQISHGGSPYEYREAQHSRSQVVTLQKPDMEAVKREDKIYDTDKSIPYRFGINNPVDLGSDTHGEWFTAENGDRVWRLRIEAPDARSLNFVFDAYLVPEGGKVFVYDPSQKEILGSFTSENANEHYSLGVGLLHSSEMIIEYIEPAEVAGEGYLHINNITYGYRDLMGRMKAEKAGPFGNAGPCNIDVNCPEGIPFDIQKRSVAIIVVNNNGSCSGALVNNTAGDQAPLFLTANHCLGNVSNWVFYFNHETPNCNGDPETAPTNQSISGSTLLASDSPSDFALLELSSNVPASYNVCYSGWDATDSETTVTSSYGIHHPRGDVKKVCRDNDPPYHGPTTEFAPIVWWIDEWEDGVTEGGSSGSPLFNQNGNIIGQLAGGLAACNGAVNNGEYDFYGRFGHSWDAGSGPGSRLRDWLDPINSGVLVLPNSCLQDVPDLDASLGSFSNDETIFCDAQSLNNSIDIINIGNNTITSATIAVTFNGSSQGNIEWTGSLDSFESDAINLPSVNLVGGINVIEATILTVNGVEDENSANNSRSQEMEVFENSSDVEVFIDFDNWSSEVSWEITYQNGEEIYSNAYGFFEDFTSEVYCLGEGCYTFTIFDSAFDGICCEYGQGSYTISVVGGSTLIESNGEYGGQESNDFCIGPLGTHDGPREVPFEIYPNPASGIFRAEGFNRYGSETKNVVITDILGKRVRDLIVPENQDVLILDANTFAEGIYIMSFSAEGRQFTNKFVVTR